MSGNCANGPTCRITALSLNVVAWCWEKAADRHLVVVNLSEVRSQALIKLPWTELAGHSWRLTDPLQQTAFERSGDELRESGLYVDLEPWGYHLLNVRVIDVATCLGDFLTVGAHFYVAHSERKRDDMQGMPTSENRLIEERR